jgi:hypothetical protein
VKLLLTILLITILVLIVLPMSMEMDGMGWCPACLTGNAAHALALCLIALSTVTANRGLLNIQYLPLLSLKRQQRLFASPLFRPPR